MTAIIGIDASEYQDTEPPWAKCDFGIIRATIGYREDARFEQHYKALRASGKPFAFYHALLKHNPPNDSDTRPPQQFDPVRQVDALLQIIGDEDLTPIRVGGVLVPRVWVDVEAPDVDAALLAAFLAEFRRRRPGVLIGIYTSRYMWQEWGGHGLIGPGHAEFAACPLWVAAYPSPPPAYPNGAAQRLPIPDIWEQALIEQFRSKAGYFASYPKDLDINELRPQPEIPMPIFTPNDIRLGPHHMQGGNATGKWLKLRPRVGKFETTDLGASVEALPGTLALGRANDWGKLGGQGFDPNRQRLVQTPAQALEQYRAFLQPYIDANPACAAWEGPNEPVLRSSDKEAADPKVKAVYDEDRKQTMLWYAEFCNLFAQWLHGQGKIAVIGSWASGQPRVEDDAWQHWGRALQASRDFGALQAFHDYAGDTSLARVKYNNAEWTKLGYPNLRQVITELGVNEYGGGWKGLYADWNECYARLIKPWLDAVYALPFEVDATWFTDGTGGNLAWDGLNVSGTNVVELLAAYVPPSPVVEETMPISKAQQTEYLNNLDAAAAKVATTRAAIAALEPDDAPAAPVLYHAKALGDLVLRDSSGNPAHDATFAPTGDPGGVVKAGTVVPVYKDNVTAGVYLNRAVITPDGKNVWGIATALAKV